jgi:hypothetical protein
MRKYHQVQDLDIPLIPPPRFLRPVSSAIHLRWANPCRAPVLRRLRQSQWAINPPIRIGLQDSKMHLGVRRLVLRLWQVWGGRLMKPEAERSKRKVWINYARP